MVLGRLACYLVWSTLPIHAQPAAGAAEIREAGLPTKAPIKKRALRKGLRDRRKGPSLVGPWPGQGDPEVERVRKCILRREGGADYRIADPSNRWFGAYQFQLSTSNEAARRMKRPDLVGVPANRWSPADQDAAFYVIYDRGRGRKHWAGGAYACL